MRRSGVARPLPRSRAMSPSPTVSAAALAAAALVVSSPAIGQARSCSITHLTHLSWLTGGRADTTSADGEAVVARPKSLYRWDLGGWVGGLGLGGPEVGDGPHAGGGPGHGEPTGFGGMGLQARYRMRRNWGLELSAGALHSEGRGGTARDMFPVQAALLYYLKPTGILQAYGLAGAGIAPARWYDRETDVTLGASTAGLGELGGGLAVDLHPIRLNADLRWVGMVPSLGAGGGEPPDGTLPCPGCGDAGVPVDGLRDAPTAALGGVGVRLAASLVF